MRGVQRTGVGAYNFKAAVGSGLIKPGLTPELVAAVQRLEANAPLLNKAVAIARAYGNAVSTLSQAAQQRQ